MAFITTIKHVMMNFELFVEPYALPCEWVIDRPEPARKRNGIGELWQGQWQLYLINGETNKKQSQKVVMGMWKCTGLSKYTIYKASKDTCEWTLSRISCIK